MNRSTGDARILIINPFPIGADCPIGIMMENLFGDHDPSRILQLYTNDCKIADPNKFEARKISLTNSIFTQIKASIGKLRKMRKKLSPKSYDLDDRVASKLVTTGGHASSLMSWKNLLVPAHIDKGTLRDIREFRPTVIYTQGYSYMMLKYIHLLSRIISCPVVVHTLDDWMETQYTKSPVSAIPFRKFTRLFKRILNNGRKHMVISPHMGEYMKAKYGGRYSFVMNCCGYPGYIKNTNQSDVRNIIYTGGLMLNRYVMLNGIAECIEELNKDGKIFELHIYAPILQIEAYRNLMCGSIVFHDYVKQEDVHGVLVNGDVLLHVESFNENIIRFTNYSLSTKIPECLASGRPLLYYGPLSIGVARFLSEEGVGIVTDQIEDVRKQLIQLYRDPDYYEKVASSGYEYGDKFLEKRIMQDRLIRCLAEG